MWNVFALKLHIVNPIFSLIMSVSSEQFVSRNFAEFLLDNAQTGNEILAVLDDIVEVTNTAL